MGWGGYGGGGMGWFSPRRRAANVELLEDYTSEIDAAETDDERRQRNGAELQEARRAATERYAAIAELIKREAGVRKHFKHKQIRGLALSAQGKILAPEGITRRQLYVLAHECAHILLHSSPATMRKASHVKELEAEVYAHRAFARFGLEVPENSARWARAYVGN